MAFEDDPEHVVALALEPIGAAPDGDDRVDLGRVGVAELAVADARLDADAVAMLERAHVEHDLEALAVAAEALGAAEGP